MVSVDIMPCTRLTSNMRSAWYLLASGMTDDLTNFWVVALRVSVACSKLSPHIFLRSSGVVLECRLDDKNVLGGPMPLRVYAWSSSWPFWGSLIWTFWGSFLSLPFWGSLILAIMRIFSWQHNFCYYSHRLLLWRFYGIMYFIFIRLVSCFCRWRYLSLAFLFPYDSLECSLFYHTNDGNQSSVEVIHVMNYNLLSSVCC